MISTDKEAQFKELKSSLTNLVNEYKQARELMGDQMQAVIYNDLVWLNSLVEQQLQKYDTLNKLEENFKDQLHKLFSEYGPAENKHSLGILLDYLEEPSEELNQLRHHLHEQVEKTQSLREQLMDLLQFAREHNAETFEAVFQIAADGSESYNALGKKQRSAVNSLAINQKA